MERVVSFKTQDESVHTFVHLELLSVGLEGQRCSQIAGGMNGQIVKAPKAFILFLEIF